MSEAKVKTKGRGQRASGQSVRVYRARAVRLERENAKLDGKLLTQEKLSKILKTGFGEIRSKILASSLPASEQERLLMWLAELKETVLTLRPTLRSLHQRTV